MTIDIANSIPIFDTLSHPTLNTNCLYPRYDGQADINQNLKQMQQYSIFGTFGVGMKGIGEYQEDEYVKMCKNGG